MSDNNCCVARHLNHVCIAVNDIVESIDFYTELFALEETEIQEIPDQGVKAALVTLGGSQIEFIEPIDSQGSVARFISKNGEGVHHICFEVQNLQGTLDALTNKGIDLIDKTPRAGLSGRIAFIHPRATRGLLIELVDQDTTGR